MNKIQQQVLEFHQKFNVNHRGSPGLIPEDRSKLRIKLIDEELTELKEAIAKNDIVGIADALADLNYVVMGTGVEYGIDLEVVGDEVHRSNMTKLWPFCTKESRFWTNDEIMRDGHKHSDEGVPLNCTDARAYLREDGKVIKNPNYTAADIEAALERQVEKGDWREPYACKDTKSSGL